MTKRGTILTAPFTVVCDSREQAPYTFASIRADSHQRRRPLVVPTIRRGIPTGDYSIDGYDGSSQLIDGLRCMSNYPRGIAVERKSLADLFNTLGSSRARFTRELERLAEYEFAAVVVEATWEQVLSVGSVGNGTHFGGGGGGAVESPAVRSASSVAVVRSQLNPKTIYRSVIAWQQRYPRIHWWFCPGRAFAEVTTFRILERWWKERVEKMQKEVEREKKKAV